MVSHYKNITILTNIQRTTFLHEVRNKIIEYFNNARPQGYLNEPVENETARKKRSEINMIIQRAYEFVSAANVPTTYIYREAPMAGGRTYEIDTLINIFQLASNHIPPDASLDPVERAIGVYENDKRNSLIRTINPFWWTKRILDLFSLFPLFVLSAIGFNFNTLENSIVGKLIRGAVWLIGALFLLLQIDQILDLGFSDFVRSQFFDILKLDDTMAP